ncbi:2-polyprenyl-6-methoxyphenol hydroxylase-like FAD-dependent oxidoreductase [Bradyrhizobium sp. LB1.3]
MDEEFDVSIVGAGPVGPWLACELALPPRLNVVCLVSKSLKTVS